jgi:hypothetical protein
MNATFEIHVMRFAGEAPANGQELPWHDGQPASRPPVFRLESKPNPVWLDFDAEIAALLPVQDSNQAALGLKVVRRKLGVDLALVARRPWILVNGLPALPLCVVGARDSILLAPGWLGYVTERVQPHVGIPLAEHLGMKCPFCRIPVAPGTRIVTCRCGAPYHHETAESHETTGANDRLTCFTKVSACLACGRALSLMEHLVWDPATL